MKSGHFYYMAAPEVIAGRRYGSKAIHRYGRHFIWNARTKTPHFSTRISHQLEQTICDPYRSPCGSRNNRDTPEELSRLVERLLDKKSWHCISSVEEILYISPIMRWALVHLQINLSRVYQHDNNQEHKTLFSIGMMRNQCDRIFKACQSYDSVKRKPMTDDGTKHEALDADCLKQPSHFERLWVQNTHPTEREVIMFEQYPFPIEKALFLVNWFKPFYSNSICLERNYSR